MRATNSKTWLVAAAQGMEAISELCYWRPAHWCLAVVRGVGWFANCCMCYYCTTKSRRWFPDSWERGCRGNVRERRPKGLVMRDPPSADQNLISLPCLWFQIACLVPVSEYQLYQRLKFERGTHPSVYSGSGCGFHVDHLHRSFRARLKHCQQNHKGTTKGVKQ